MYRRLMLFGLIVLSCLGTWGTIPCSADFDRQACERACRTRYGGPGVFNDDDSGHKLMSLDSCMQDCDRRFWDDFDRKTDEMERNGRRGAQ
jgi:hypothetical protein